MSGRGRVVRVPLTIAQAEALDMLLRYASAGGHEDVGMSPEDFARLDATHLRVARALNGDSRSIPDEVLQITAGVGTVYVIRRVYVGESVTDLIVEVIDGGDLNDYEKPGEELLRVAEDSLGWFRAANLVANAVAGELRIEEGVDPVPAAAAPNGE